MIVESKVKSPQDETMKRINAMVDLVYTKYHRELTYAEFEPLIIQSYRFYSNLLMLSIMNIEAVSSKKFPNLICDMASGEELNDFLFFANTERLKKELNDNHK